MMMMATRDDVTVRIDVELRAKAKELDINLSRLLEDALRDEVERRETIAQTLEGKQQIRLKLEDDEGRPYVGKLTGTLLGEGHSVQAFLADDERLIVYEEDKGRYHEVDPAELEDWFPHDPGVLAEVMHAIGETPEIEL
jgi:post-segregation antitoxin (ccd killing protein)